MSRRLAFLGITCLAILALGCQPERVTDAPRDGAVTVVGRLVAMKDDRPADGGIELTIATDAGNQEILRIGSAFIAEPREQVLALHQVVDSSKIGDRLKASGRRDESGAIVVDRLEKL